MKAGKWLNNGVPVIFDTEEHLIDGHHRLTAIVKSGIAVMMSVCRGVEHEAFTTFDCGRKRNVAQLLSMNGVKHYCITAAIIVSNAHLVRWGRLYHHNSPIGGVQLSNDEAYNIYTKDSEGYNEATLYAYNLYSNAGILPSSWVGGLYYFLTHKGKLGKDYVKFFFDNLISLNTSSNKTIELFRKRLIKEKMGNTKTNDSIIFAILVKVWNCYRTGTSLKTLKFDPNVETYPKLILGE